MAAVIVRPATAADIAAFAAARGYTHMPTMKAWVGELEGRVIAIGGAALHRGRWYGFIDLEDEARPYKMHIMRSAIRFLEEAGRSGIRAIYAEVCPTEAKSLPWLTRLGFRLHERSQHYYLWKANDHAQS